jgi:hypothetical protein
VYTYLRVSVRRQKKRKKEKKSREHKNYFITHLNDRLSLALAFSISLSFPPLSLVKKKFVFEQNKSIIKAFASLRSDNRRCGGSEFSIAVALSGCKVIFFQ